MKKRLTAMSALLVAFGATTIYLFAQGNAGEDRLANALKEKLEFEKKFHKNILDMDKKFPRSQLSSDPLHIWSLRWLNTELELHKSQKDRIAACQAHFDRMLALNESIKKLEAVEPVQKEFVRYYLLEAAAILEKEKAK